MKRTNNKFLFKTNVNNIEFNAKFLRRMHKITKWLRMRYEIKEKEAHYKHVFMDDDKTNGLITIIIDFDGEQKGGQ